MYREQLVTELEKYQLLYPDELETISRFNDLLFFEDCFSRSLLSGHLTASTWVLDKSRKQVLLLHHKKLDRWLQPGGHADGEQNLLHVAMK